MASDQDTRILQVVQPRTARGNDGADHLGDAAYFAELGDRIDRVRQTDAEVCDAYDPGEPMIGSDPAQDNEAGTQAGIAQLTGEPGTASSHFDPAVTPPRMPPEGLPGLLGDIAHAATEKSEASPVAIAITTLTMFSALLGRGPYISIGDGIFHARPFVILAGKSSKARKGTSEQLPRKLFRQIDELLATRTQSTWQLHVHSGGLSSGEGIVYAIRDASEVHSPRAKADPGVADKRLLVVEPEFASVLELIRREGNILSAILRNLFDGRDLEPLTKRDRVRASQPHVAIIGHITNHELRSRATEVDISNGLLNRFLYLHVQREKLVALPEQTPAHVIDAFAKRIADVVLDLTNGDWSATNTLNIGMSAGAQRKWCEVYEELSQDRHGRLGALTARNEFYGRMLAMIFAAFDGRRMVEECDITAALAWVRYSAESISYIYREPDEPQELSPLAQQVLQFIVRQPGITGTQINRCLHGNCFAKDIREALERLLNVTPPKIKCEKVPNPKGRPTLHYYPAETK